MQSADIRAFIQDVSKATGRTFIIDPRVQGTVTIAGGDPMPDDQMLDVFLFTQIGNAKIKIFNDFPNDFLKSPGRRITMV